MIKSEFIMLKQFGWSSQGHVLTRCGELESVPTAPKFGGWQERLMKKGF